nr:hypothetical protein [Nocardia cyriacigeorgica]
MAEGVDDVAVAVAVELVLCGALELRAELDGTGDDVVDVIDVDEREYG